MFVCPIDPRTRKVKHYFLIEIPDKFTIIDPLGYLDIMEFIYHSFFTDNNRLHKHVLFLNKQCVTLSNTMANNYFEIAN